VVSGDGAVPIAGTQPVGEPGALGPDTATQRSVKLPLDPSTAKLSQAGSEYVIVAPVAGAVPPTRAVPISAVANAVANAVVLRRRANVISSTFGVGKTQVNGFLMCQIN
jgi:hypothetical protein